MLNGVKEFNEMSVEEQEVVANNFDSEGKFICDFKVQGKSFSEMTPEEKTIVYIQVVNGMDEGVTRDLEEYDKTTVVLSEDEYIVNETPYGTVGVSNVLKQEGD